MSYKEEHEAFVSDNPGTTLPQITAAVLAAILPIHLRDLLCAIYPNIRGTLGNGFWANLLFDFITVIFPMQLLLTVCSQVLFHCLLAIVMAIALVCYMNLRQKKMKLVCESVSLLGLKMGNRRPFITYYRAFVNVITAFTILAVDFAIFPRYFGKTETYGTGLMDVGVGCFLISNAIVSPEARGKVSSDSFVPCLFKSFKSSVPLLILGCGRVLAVKSADYQEHVTEYGVHWNFFFTLAVVKVVCTVMFCFVPPRFWNAMGVITIAMYQHGLTYDNLKEYIINSSDGKGGRDDLFDANREGIFSCLGYLTVYILNVQLGKLILKQREKVSDWFKLCIHLTVVSATSWILLHFCEKHVEPVSRRFANLAYVLWMVALNSLILLVILVFDIVVTCVDHLYTAARKPESKETETDKKESEVMYNTSALMYAVNHNGLFYFLFANLLTGCVNMTVRTIYQPAVVAMVILTGYMFVLSSVTSYLYHKKITLKFW